MKSNDVENTHYVDCQKLYPNWFVGVNYDTTIYVEG